MTRVHHHHEPAMATQVPLFSSSWIALFVTLRDNFARGGEWNPAGNVSPKTGSVGQSH